MTTSTLSPSAKTESHFASPLFKASLSTMWAFGNFSRLEDFFQAALQLGYASIELNYQVTPELLEGIDLKRYSFSSIHEHCPSLVPHDEMKRRGWMISATDEQDRQHGVESVKRSIDLAQELAAPVVVVHCGQISMPTALEKQLRTMYAAGLEGTPAFEAVNQRMVEDRKSESQPYFEAVKRSIGELINYAAPKGVCLGLENRYHWTDIPTQDEMDELLALGSPEQVGFWFDSGHAIALHRLGFLDFEAWLQRFSNRLVGCHLHDAIGVEDHQSPGMGSIDFKLIGRYLPQNAIRTLELHPRMTRQQVNQGIRHLAEKKLVVAC